MWEDKKTYIQLLTSMFYAIFSLEKAANKRKMQFKKTKI